MFFAGNPWFAADLICLVRKLCVSQGGARWIYSKRMEILVEKKFNLVFVTGVYGGGFQWCVCHLR
jgi:hypothetical protein